MKTIYDAELNKDADSSERRMIRDRARIVQSFSLERKVFIAKSAYRFCITRGENRAAAIRFKYVSELMIEKIKQDHC